MGFTVRSARSEDIDSIVSWTTDTFEWGDYVPERLPGWLESDISEVLVCVDEEGDPKAIAHVTMLSATEGWMEGARVHPDYRRSGMGTALNRAGVAWAREQGARVVRLATERDNEAANSQVKGLGYRVVSSWIHAELTIDANHRCDERFKLRRVPGSDASAAWLFWAAGDLSLSGRELIAIGWQWRTARPEDLTAAVATGNLLQSTAGWVIVDQPAADWLRTAWVATTPDDILGLLDGLLDHAAERGVEGMDVKLPNLPWTLEALTRAGSEPREVLVHALAV